MTYFFVDSDGTENVSNFKPSRTTEGFWEVKAECKINGVNTVCDALTEMPKGTMEKLFGKQLTYQDDPIIVV